MGCSTGELGIDSQERQRFFYYESRPTESPACSAYCTKDNRGFYPWGYSGRNL